ncbi:MAG TPA: DnaJ domain-containing protein [Kofleriaceae bacterium]
MAELARGSVADRPWGRTFATLGLRGLTGQLSVSADGKRFLVAFDQGAVVAATSPLTSDATVRVALTSHLVSSSQVPEIARRLAAAPERDDVDVIAELARLGPEHALRLRRRVIAQRAARTFSINQGEFVVTDHTELAILAGCELDVRALVYMGARTNLSELRLSAELDRLGAWFRLKPGADDDLPQFGFSDVEQPVVERLRDGGTLAEIEDFATSFVDGRTVRAVIYALAACGACELERAAGQPHTRLPTRPGSPTPAPPDQTQPLPRTMTQPLPRVATPPRTGTLPLPPVGAPPPAPEPSRAQRPSPSAPRDPEPPVQSKTTTRVATVPPPPRPAPLASGSDTLRPPAEVFDAPTWRDADDGLPPIADRPRPDAPGAAPRRADVAPGREAAHDPVRRPEDDTAGRGSIRAPRAATQDPGSETSGRARPPSGNLARRESSSEAIRLPGEDAAQRNSASAANPPPDEDALRREGLSGSSGSSGRARKETLGREGLSGSIRLPDEETLGREGLSGSSGRARKETLGREGSSAEIRLPRLPDDDAGGREGLSGSSGSSGRARKETLGREGSSAEIGLPRLPGAAGREGLTGSSGSSGRLRKETLGREGSSAEIGLPRLPEEETLGREGLSGSSGSSGRLRKETPGHEGSSVEPRLPGEAAPGREGLSGSSGSSGRSRKETLGREGSSAEIRLPHDDAARRNASGVIALPGDDAFRREGSSAALRLLREDALARDGSSGALRLPGEDALGGEGSSGGIPLPGEDALGGEGSSGVFAMPADAGPRAGARGSSDEGRRRQSSNPGLRRPLDAESGPGVVVRRVSASRPAPVRQVARVDSPQSHEVKALIAQRLKLLDQGADHFQLLGVGHDVPADALRKAYFALARQLHPDRLAALGISDDGKHAQRLFAQINAGFAVLSDQGRRSRYLDILRRGGEAAIRAEQARAEDLARRILDAEEAFRRGELALRRDQPGAAVAELERAVQLNPDETDYHAALAWSRFCAAPDKPVIAAATRTALERAIQRAPRAVTARFYLGRVERMLGRDEDALRHFRDVLASAPGHAEAASEVRALESRRPDGDKPRGLFGRPKR